MDEMTGGEEVISAVVDGIDGMLHGGGQIPILIDVEREVTLWSPLENFFWIFRK